MGLYSSFSIVSPAWKHISAQITQLRWPGLPSCSLPHTAINHGQVLCFVMWLFGQACQLRLDPSDLHISFITAVDIPLSLTPAVATDTAPLIIDPSRSVCTSNSLWCPFTHIQPLGIVMKSTSTSGVSQNVDK